MAYRGGSFPLTSGLLLCAVLRTVQADVGVALRIEDIAGDDWRLAGIVVDIGSAEADRLEFALRVESLVLPDELGELRELAFRCGQAQHDETGWHCHEGMLTLAASPWQAQQTPWSGSWLNDGRLQLSIPRLSFARGTVAVELDAAQPDWQAGVTANRLQVKPLSQLAAALRPPKGWTGDGRVSGRIVLAGRAADLNKADVDVVVDGLAYASDDGTQAGEGIVIKLDGNAKRRSGAWQFDSRIRWPKGEIYSEPLHVDATRSALTVDASGRFDAAAGRIGFDSWSVDLDKTLRISGTGTLETGNWLFSDLTVAAHSDAAQRLYDVLVQPFLIGTPADELQVDGHVGFVLHYDAKGVEQAGLELNQLAFTDRHDRFSLASTNGHVAWGRDDTTPVSQLSTAGFSIYKMRSDAFDLRVKFAADRIDLVDPLVVPVLGGTLALQSFAMQGATPAGDAPRWKANAAVRAVSLEQLTQALDWPPFAGSLSGELRDMQYLDGMFSIGGGLRVAAFDGEIRVDGLTITDPLGQIPELRAAATMRDLSLAAVTSTFAFGRIEGRLNGDLTELHLVAWQPQRFDLHLYTPDGDDSRHRISQRAVQNLTELGSGVPAGLSSTVLSIFEEFSYAAIDVNVSLRGSVADLGGLERKDGGYYLVRGSGLPRIDVIGRNRSVAWKDLLERLQQIRVEGVQVR